jgi:hypothetical protein
MVILKVTSVLEGYKEDMRVTFTTKKSHLMMFEIVTFEKEKKKKKKEPLGVARKALLDVILIYVTILYFSNSFHLPMHLL